MTRLIALQEKTQLNSAINNDIHIPGFDPSAYAQMTEFNSMPGFPFPDDPSSKNRIARKRSLDVSQQRNTKNRSLRPLSSDDEESAQYFSETFHAGRKEYPRAHSPDPARTCRLPRADLSINLRSRIPIFKGKQQSKNVKERSMTLLQKPSDPQWKKLPFSDHSGTSGRDPDWSADGFVGHPRQSTASNGCVPFERQASNEYAYEPPNSPSKSYQGKHDEPKPDQTNLYQRLRFELKTLKLENQNLENRLRQPQARMQIVYRISRPARHQENSGDESIVDLYIDKPQWLKGDKNMALLQGHLPITDMDAYLDRHPELVFIVFRDSSAGSENAEGEERCLDVSWSESIKITSPSLIKNVRTIVDQVSRSLNRHLHLDLVDPKAELPAPYLPFYHYGDMLKDCAANLPACKRQEWSLLVDYIDQAYGNEYERVQQMLKSGAISREFMPYLIKDGDVLICNNSCHQSAYLAISQPSLESCLDLQDPVYAEGKPIWSTSSICETAENDGFGAFDINVDVRDHSYRHFESQLWTIRTQVWEFDGNFQKDNKNVSLKIPSGRKEILLIEDLDVYPIRYAAPDLVKKLRERGLQFWKSRSKRYVSYRFGENMNSTNNTELRYMIDPLTYKKLHKKDSRIGSFRDDLGSARMSAQEPPQDPFILLLPSTINGFNMRNKKWEELEVAQISDVHWNKEAFESLVVEPSVKTIIKALVIQQLKLEKGTDFIAGKGDGLIILLHGAPGTGKTFTAETVAEIAEKPLYRVTCGDLGTDPTAVEKYLDSVLHLGKIWDCVVLLDEAEVYLEERSMESLDRNALVSVFLRILEYYEGILILTSNRVGTFDEAFKSRIQLSLPYEKLGRNDRCRIWENFIQRLQKAEEAGVNFDNINRHVHDLANHDLNGRQIRNAITTARQLARYQEKELDFEHLQQVINITLKFEEYTTEMQGGRNDQEIKRDDGIRA
ncbi:MAG: hypothetical protein Q9164_004573 [Protoblastenia rupestris]